jgi:hypothetical protein
MTPNYNPPGPDADELADELVAALALPPAERRRALVTIMRPWEGDVRATLVIPGRGLRRWGRRDGGRAPRSGGLVRRPGPARGGRPPPPRRRRPRGGEARQPGEARRRRSFARGWSCRRLASRPGGVGYVVVLRPPGVRD